MSSLSNKMASDKIAIEFKSCTTDQYGQFYVTKSGYSLIGCILQAGGTTPFWCKIRHSYSDNGFYVIVYSGVLETDGTLTSNTSNYTLVWVKNS